MDNEVLIKKAELERIYEELTICKKQQEFLANEINLISIEKFIKNRKVPKEEIKNKRFVDGLILGDLLKSNSRMFFSKRIPYESFLEFEIEGCGDICSFYVKGCYGSIMLVEFVTNGLISKQEIVRVNEETIIEVRYDKFVGVKKVRFRSMDKKGYIRILQIKNKFSKKRSLAYYIL